MRFDFHKYKTYKECPRKYDFGARDVPTPVEENKYYAVYGQLVQKFFEMYANQHIPATVPLNRQGISRFMLPFYDQMLQYSHVDWGHPMSKLDRQGLFDDAVAVILSNLQSLDLYRERTRSELKVEVTLKGGDVLVGKIDFAKTMADGSVVLMDGKTTGTLGKGIDPGQLLFYAGLYHSAFKVMPRELWFVYYKLLVKECVQYDSTDVRYQVQDIISTLSVVKSDTSMLPTPSAKACKYCKWLPICKEGAADMASRRRGPRNKELNLVQNPSDNDFVLI